MSAPSVRAAALAFALSSWVEGLTQIRSALLMPYLPRNGPEDEPDTTPVSQNGSWKDRMLAWLRRGGREMDETERTALGVVDVTTAFIILQILRQPMLPFLLSPLLTTLPLPRSTAGFKATRWPQLVLSTFLLSLFHEAERASVALAVDCVRKRREARNKELLGEVYVRGDELRLSEDDEEDDPEECLICAGVGADNTLSQSISSLSSMATTSAPMDALGPLEAFCVTAPQKHVAHRSCFLSWHAAYRQQRIHLPPEQVELQHTVSEAARKHACAILDAAGFSHLSRLIRFPHELPWTRVHPPSSDPQPLVRPALTLTNDLAGPSSSTSGSSRSLATLHTTTPPCPGCRSSVLLHFFSRRPPMLSRDRVQSRTRKETVRAFARVWVHHWHKLVTGRTVLYRLASQWSFVMALLSMLRVSGGTVRWTYV